MTVRITGGDLDGSTFENAATAALQNEIIAAIKGVEKSTEKRNQEDGQAADDMASAASQFAANVAKGSAEIAGAVGGTALDFSGALLTGKYEITDYTKIVSERFGSLGDKSGIVGAGLGALGMGMNELTKYTMESYSTFKDLASVGGGLEGDLIAIRQAAANTRMPLDQFAGMVTANTGKLLALGGSVDQGTMRFVNVSKAMFDSKLGSGLQALGVGFEELNEFTIDYMDMQRRNSRFQNMSTTQQAAAAAEYVQELDLLAKFTGRSRKELQQSARDEAKSGAVQASLRLMESRGIKGAQEQFESLSKDIGGKVGPGFQKMFSAMVRLDGAIDPTDSGMVALKAAAPEAAEALSRAAVAFKKGDMEEARRLQEEANALAMKRMNSPEFLRIAELGSVAGNVGAAAENLLGANQDVLDAVNKHKEAVETTTGSTISFNEAIASMTESLKKAQTDTQEQEVTGAIVATENLIRDGAAAVSNTLATDLKPAIENGAAAVRDTLSIQSSTLQKATDNVAGTVGGHADTIAKLESVAPQLAEEYKQAVEKFRNAPSIEAQRDAMAAMMAIEDRAERLLSENSGNAPSSNAPPASEDDDSWFKPIKDFFGNLLEFNDGTMGSGNLFQDFGSGKLAMLHGEEAVVTPKQMSGLLQSARGTSANSMTGGTSLGSVSPAGGADSGMGALAEKLDNLNSNMEQLIQINNDTLEIDMKHLKTAKAQLRDVFSGLGVG